MNENEKDAEAYRLAQAQRMLDLFETANGHPARSLEELEKWVVSPEGQAALANNRNPGRVTIDAYY
jgi:hypothetical protein